ncbi:Chaperone protein dnaJ [Zostera marina]|uniref:Chaperone protein dnaJ n=1 Tax=Zostera marina TaxID=29655 RepID=A0A0K9PFA2_ZOSMR|nr:Chaperone protein dnaJ [Zostera marina]
MCSIWDIIAHIVAELVSLLDQWIPIFAISGFHCSVCYFVEWISQSHIGFFCGLCLFRSAVHRLDRITVLFIVCLFGMAALWIYQNFWITIILFIFGGYMFSLNHVRMAILATVFFSVYRVYICKGWIGIFLSVNLGCLSTDLTYNFVQPKKIEGKLKFEFKESNVVVEDFEIQLNSSSPDSPVKPEIIDLPESEVSCEIIVDISNSKTKITENIPSLIDVAKPDLNIENEMKRIINSANHYEAIGLIQKRYIDQTMLRKEYRKKAMLVHPDKNMGNTLSCESFKKLQSAYEVLSDTAKRKDYDEQLKREESRIICQKSCSAYHQNSMDHHRSKESRRVECGKCGKSHLWVCTTRIKAKARWCQDCHLHHPAKEGDGWVEYERVVPFSTPRKVDIPHAYVCAENKIFAVSEWASCQFHGAPCRANTHCPSFHLGRPRCTDTSKWQWEVRQSNVISENEEFELWVEHAMASGLLTPKSKKSWSPLKILNHHKKELNLRRMSLP